MALVLGLIVWASAGAIVAIGNGFSCFSYETAYNKTGWPNESGAGITAGAIGLVLWALAGVAMGMLPGRKWLMVLVYLVVYIAALFIFAAEIAPAIWGESRCVPA